MVVVLLVGVLPYTLEVHPYVSLGFLGNGGEGIKNGVDAGEIGECIVDS